MCRIHAKYNSIFAIFSLRSSAFVSLYIKYISKTFSYCVINSTNVFLEPEKVEEFVITTCDYNVNLNRNILNRFNQLFRWLTLTEKNHRYCNPCDYCNSAQNYYKQWITYMWLL